MEVPREPTRAVRSAPTGAPRPGGVPASLLLARWVLALGLVLLAVHVALTLTWRFRHSVRQELVPLLVVSDEWSVMTWATVCVTALLGLLCVAAGRAERRRGWYAVGGLFLYLSMDDATMLHERVGWLADGVGGPASVYAWVRVMGPVLAALGLFAAGFLWRRFAGDGGARLRVLLAFAAMGTALALEVLEGPLHESGLRWRGFTLERYTIALEELLELIGPTLLAATVGLRLERRLGRRGEDADDEADDARAAA